MSITPQTLGTPNDVIWGTNGTFASGRIIKSRSTQAIESDPSLNNDGVQTGEVTIPKINQYDFDMEYQTSVTPPASGASGVTILGDAGCIIDSVELGYTRGKRATCSIKAHSYPS